MPIHSVVPAFQLNEDARNIARLQGGDGRRTQGRRDEIKVQPRLRKMSNVARPPRGRSRITGLTITTEQPEAIKRMAALAGAGCGRSLPAPTAVELQPLEY
jgi:hypothetical protein